ncbi:hypothetical protein ACRBEV_11435 [Methylobacterium phyllosphaerae]
MSTAQIKLEISLNPNLINKNEAGDTSFFALGWQNVEVTPDEFTTAIAEYGWAYCAQVTGVRKESNFLACNIASVDVDHGLTVEEALASPLVQQHALLLYTTVRHTPDDHRFRLVFPLSETITNPRRMRQINRGLARRLGGDMAATDPARISFGHRNAQVHHLGGAIGPELLRELIADARLPDATDLSARGIMTRRSTVVLRPDHELQLEDGRLMPLCDAPVRARVHCPVHLDENPSAVVIQNRRGENGIFCSSCAKSYWTKAHQHDDYDPEEFVRTARAIAAAAVAQSAGDTQLNRGGATQEQLAGCRVRIVSGQAAPAVLQPGITLVRSDKGTGKTEALKRLSAGAQTVLLVGHRRTLIRGSCKRLSLRCYLDENKAAKSERTPERDNASLLGFLVEDEDEH